MTDGRPAPEPISVRGGAGGIEARYDDLLNLARRYGQAATDVAGTAWSLHGYLVDPIRYASGLVDPAGLAKFQVSLAAALDGPHGLSALAVRCGAQDVALRAAAATYLAADRLETESETTLGGLVGAPAAFAHAISVLDRTHDIPAAFNALLTREPALADELIAVARPYLDTAQLLYRDGRPAVRAQGPDQGADAAGPPRGLADVIAGLARRNRGQPGEIDVRRLVGTDGRAYAIVDIPGTKSWSPAPVNRDVTGIATNVRALEGQQTSYERGVLLAMHAAGVGPSDAVLLVGHSQGGLVAVAAAANCRASGEFRVTHVVTAGSPIGISARRLPKDVQLLALENDGDVVPHLDGAANPAAVNLTTVTVSRNSASLGRNHSLEDSYLPGARDVDASDDTSVRTFRASADRFFTAAEIRTSSFVITRAY